MCALCHDTGIIRKEIYPGVIETNGCNCEVAKQQQEENDKRWKAYLIKFESMKQELRRKQQQKVKKGDFSRMKSTKVEIDVTNNKIYVVKNGEVTPLNPPVTGFGEQVITWQGGKVDRVSTTITEKIK